MALTPKHKLFCEIYVGGGSQNASKAAIEAGYSAKGKSATVTSTRIMKRLDVQEYIAKLQEEAAERNNVTVDDITKELDKIGDAAKRANQFGPAVRALELKGKSIGMFKDNVVLTELQGTSDNDLIEKLAKDDPKTAAALREVLGAPEGFDTADTLH